MFFATQSTKVIYIYGNVELYLILIPGILRKILEDHKKTFDPENPRDFIDEYLKEMQRYPRGETSFCVIICCSLDSVD